MPSFYEEWKALRASEQDALQYLGDNSHKPKVMSTQNFLAFFTCIPQVLRLIWDEPEILFFLIVQWVCVILAYMAWVQFLNWIPASVWQAIDQQHGNDHHQFDLLNMVMLAWSFLIIVIVSFPLGICNAAMVAVHDLRTCNEKVTILKIFAIAFRHVGRIWLFSIMDAWVTANAILRRLPKKNNRDPASEKVLAELLYYAWKITTMAVVPALVNGRGLIQAGKDSLTLLTTQPARALGLRLGYSAVCWVVGVVTYIGAIYWFCHSGEVRSAGASIYNFYTIMGLPVFIAAGVVVVLIRPIFLLSVAQFYTDVIDVNDEIEGDVAKIPPLSSILLNWKTVVFLFLFAQVVLALMYGDQLGLVRWIHHLAAIDIANLAK